MTREEAIKGLKVLRNDFSGYKPNEEMFDMAIEALEADGPDTNVGDMVSRQAAISYAISGRIRTLPTSEDGENWIRTSEVRQSLLTMPSAQPEPKKGMWIIRDNPGTGWYRVTCSECGEDVTSTIPMIGFFPNAKPLWDYCPYCGCKMEVEDNGKQ